MNLSRLFLLTFLSLGTAVSISEAQSGGRQRVDSFQTLTGGYLIYRGIEVLKAGNDPVVGYTLLGAGVLTLANGLGVTARAAEIPETSSDPVRKFRATPEYQQLVETYGKKKTESFIADSVSGWSKESLIEKYVTDPIEKNMILDQIKLEAQGLSAYSDILNISQNLNGIGTLYRDCHQ